MGLESARDVAGLAHDVEKGVPFPLGTAVLDRSRSVRYLRGTLAPGSQRVGPLAEVPGLLEECGVGSAPVLARAGLAADALSDRDARVAFAACVRLIGACADATKRPDFPLLLASRWRLEHIGIVGEMMSSCTTVGHAVETFASIQWLNASGGTVFLRRGKGITTLGYAIYEPGVADGTHETHDLVMGIGVQMLRVLTGMSGWKPDRVQLSRPRPRDVQPYRKFFRAPVSFDAGASLLQYPSRVDAIPLPSADETLRRSLAVKVAGRREDFIPKLHRMVRVALLFGLSADDLARAMFVSNRTLNRRLSAVGTNLRDVTGVVRFEVSRQLLRDTSLPVADVASALGYTETSAFVRAFRRWSGTTPQSWRVKEAATRQQKRSDE